MLRVCQHQRKERYTSYPSIVAWRLAGVRNDLVVPDTYNSGVKTDDAIVGATRFITYSEVDFEPTTLTSFMETYQLRSVFPKVDHLKDFNPLYLYYKGIAEAGGRWPDKSDMRHWSLLTLDEVVNTLTQRDLLTKYVSAKDANIAAMTLEIDRECATENSFCNCGTGCGL